MFQSVFEWKINLRKRIDLAKASMADTCAGLENLSENNVFISQIFTGVNIFIQHAEMKRRGIEPILDSLTYFDPKRQFLITTIKDDLQASTSDINRLFSYGSHGDLRPDEMVYIKYLYPRSDECNCGECVSSTRVLLPTRAFNVFRFNPPEPQEPTRDSSISITNRGDVRIRAVRGEHASRNVLVPSNGELIMDIPSSAPFSNLISPNGGRVTISIDMQYLRDRIADVDLSEFIANNAALSGVIANNAALSGIIANNPTLSGFDVLLDEDDDDEDDDDDDIEVLSLFDDVRVLLGSRCFNSAVDIATDTDLADEQQCAICLDAIAAGGRTLGLLGVKVKCCNKVFHDTCLRHMVCDVGPPKCPLCRTDLRTICTDENCNHGECWICELSSTRSTSSEPTG
jgi:hypothetical protein